MDREVKPLDWIKPGEDAARYSLRHLDLMAE